MKLNIGAGKFRKKGYINLDWDSKANPDVTHNLNKLPYPFEDNSFHLIEADHVLEHLNNPFEVMKELHRILKPQGSLIINVPHFSRGFTHPEHQRGFDVTFPYYFNKDFQGGYVGVDFKLLDMKLIWLGQKYFKKEFFKWKYYLLRIPDVIFTGIASLSPALCSKIWCYYVGGFDEINFRFQKW